MIKAKRKKRLFGKSDSQQEWISSTKGTFTEYRGFGLHEKMLDQVNAHKNTEIIKEILVKIDEKPHN